MIKRPVKMIRVGFCQYSNYKNYMNKGFQGLITKFEELALEDPTLRTVQYKILIDGTLNKKGNCKSSHLNTHLNGGLQDIITKVEEQKQVDPAYKIIKYDIVIRGEY